MTVLVTGAAGFIGFSTCLRLLTSGKQVIGIDNLNSYYDPALKDARLAQLAAFPNFTFRKIDIASDDLLTVFTTLEQRSITEILHFAAQAGVRHSVMMPFAFADANVRGQVAIFELARRLPALRHIVYASSSSVYGRNAALPFRETDRVDQPGSFYAVSKRAAELTAECYHHLHQLPLTGLRFFSVYGPWGRPDMAYYLFARAIMEGRPVTLYEGASLARDFTFIDDAVDAICAIMDLPPSDQARILNIGSNVPEPVSRLISLLENFLGRKADIQLTSRPTADVEYTWASLEQIQQLIDWHPATSLETGLEQFSRWFLNHQYS